MDTTAIILAIISGLLGSGGVLTGAGWLFRNLLKNKDDQIGRLLIDYKEKSAECDEWSEKYVDLLKADIEERKSRDRTIELLSKAATRNHRSVFDEEST